MKDGQPVADVWVISARTVTGEEKWFNGKTDENGKFSMTLPDGEYQIEGIWIDSESKWYPSVIAFTVQDGEVVDPNAITYRPFRKTVKCKWIGSKRWSASRWGLGQCPYGDR